MGFFINKIVSKYLLVIATLALLVTTYTVNSTCLFAIHQEELPEEAFKLLITEQYHNGQRTKRKKLRRLFQVA